MKQRLGVILILFCFVPAVQGQEVFDAVPGEYIVKLKASSGGPSVVRNKVQGKANVKASFPGLGLVEIEMNADGEEQKNLNALRSDPDIEYIEPNMLWKKAEVEQDVSKKMTHEEVASSRYLSTNSNYYSQSTVTTVKISESWAVETPLSTLSTKIVVAIIDTGLDKNHVVFQPLSQGGTGGLWVNEIEAQGREGIDDDQNGFVDDINGWNFLDNNPDFMDEDDHGTHVAGIVLGSAQNIFSATFRESPIQVMPLKFLGGQGVGTTSNAIRAIYYAVNNGARVINNSWGGANYSRALHDAINYAYQNQVLVVNASGNYGSDNDRYPMYPANYNVPSNLSVASVSRYETLSSFSNYGLNSVHIGSPGEFIASTVPYNMYQEMSGTSMAAPLVAGLAARAWRESSTLSGYQIKTLLLQTGNVVGSLQGAISSSARVNALNLINASKQLVGTAAHQPQYEPVYEGERTLASTSGSGDEGGGCGLVSGDLGKGPPLGGASGGVGLALMMLPLLIWQILRTKNPKNQRKHERFVFKSQIAVKVGDREILGSINTISEGGLSFNVDEAIAKGGIVTMKIQSPDGQEVVEIQGRVVWNESNSTYGVQFSEVKQGALAMIRDWTTQLLKA